MYASRSKKSGIPLHYNKTPYKVVIKKDYFIFYRVYFIEEIKEVLYSSLIMNMKKVKNSHTGQYRMVNACKVV